MRLSAIARHFDTKDAAGPISSKALTCVIIPSGDDAITWQAMSSVLDFSLTAVFATTPVPSDDCAGELLGLQEVKKYL